ncbi:RDD family protein [Phycicoccus sp. BSK3Z-2]|uniref:RDD family protein n=1 Tax=Phycicoccus avicenniae TaxID=2828860 RepID=A0A941I049_9MICO|nr:RDD family protein [Phycicoccus avicenniae]MBR7742926.1 RDD family protein [Phycicoccus avicenniae]
MSTPTSAGWYPDPDDADQLRYFDGIVWTAHRTPRRTERPQPVEPAPTPTEPAPYDWGLAPSGGVPGAGGAYGRPVGTPGEVRLEDGAVLAEWWRRLLARIVDWFVTSIVAGLLSLPFVGPVVDAAERYFSQALTDPSPDPAPLTDAILGIALPVTLIGAAVALVYEVVFLVWKAATPGKLLLGTRVRPLGTDGPVRADVALRRQVLPLVADLLALVPFLGFLGTVLSVVDPAWLLFDPKRQALHDKVAGTVVVRR